MKNLQEVTHTFLPFFFLSWIKTPYLPYYWHSHLARHAFAKQPGKSHAPWESQFKDFTFSRVTTEKGRQDGLHLPQGTEKAAVQEALPDASARIPARALSVFTAGRAGDVNDCLVSSGACRFRLVVNWVFSRPLYRGLSTEKSVSWVCHNYEKGTILVCPFPL